MLSGMLVTIWAKDYWIEKPFTQWNEIEALAMLSNSPWAKTRAVFKLAQMMVDGELDL